MTDKELHDLWYENPVSCCRNDAELFELTVLMAGDDPGYHLRGWVDKKVNRHIADWLRCLAGHVEKGGSPYIYSCDIPERPADEPCATTTMEEFGITFSHPWGG